MANIFQWVGKNKLMFLLIAVVCYLLVNNLSTGLSGMVLRPLGVSKTMPYRDNTVGMIPTGSSFSPSAVLPPVPYHGAAPIETKDRLVIKDTNLSMLVKDVTETINKIEDASVAMGGFMIDSNLSKPEGAASGSISVRVPSDKRQEALNKFKSLGVRVVFENVIGNDVTDQYSDLEARLGVLNATKSKFETILNQATTVTDLLNVQRELVNLQSQIDSVKGQQMYLSQTAKLSRISIYLSTDELALPYAPDTAWRPAIVFKEAVRSMIGTVRGLGNMVIWLGVYSPVWILVLVIVLVIRKRKQM